MTKNPHFAQATIDAETDAVTARLNGGYLRIYSGQQPSSADARTTGVLLAELRWADPAFSPSSRGAAVALPLAPVQAIAEGKATWFRASTRDEQPVFDGSVGEREADFDLVIDNVDLKPGAQVTLKGFQYG